MLGRLGDFASPSDLAQWLEASPAADDWSAASGYVAKLLADPDLAKYVRERGVEYAAQWTWDEMVDRTLEVYREVAAVSP